MLSKLDKAIAFAANAHRDQLRKTTKMPYILHPYSVAMILSQAGCSEDCIVAGLLHDTIEDTSVTFDDIVKEFGRHVAEIVEGSSEPDKSASWEERKTHTIQHLKTASIEVCLVVCADKIHNCRSLYEDYLHFGEELWDHFKRGKDKQAWYYQSILETLKNRIGTHPLYQELEQIVKKNIWAWLIH